ncbi:hypothetical protein C8R44DRAFT_581253, partial [Mycena epipterygia]
TVRIWDAESHQQIGEPLEGHNGWVTSVAFSPDGRRIISGSKDHTVRIWDAETHQKIGESLRSQADGWLVGPNGELLLWIPHHLVPQIPCNSLLGICGGRPMIRFDPTTPFYHGEEWTRCKTG